MNPIKFSEEYPDELRCKSKIKEIRDRLGVVCLRCDGKAHYWKRDKEMYACKSCKHRTSLKSGTVMHKSRLPYRYWLLAIHLITSFHDIKKEYLQLYLNEFCYKLNRRYVGEALFDKLLVSAVCYKNKFRYV